LTAKDLSDDIINGLELGACDYITKPFHNRELLLRINNALKYKKENKELKIEDITIDPLKMEVKKQEQIINLTTLEYQLFLYLVENKNRIVTREMLYEKIYELSGNDVSDNTLTVYIKRIREKLGSENIIKNIKGIGYRVSS
jgi:DNA-binding response OmpR family regulator